FFSSRRRHTRSKRDWSSDVCSSDLLSSVTTIFANLVGRSFVSAITHTPASGPFALVTIPARSLSPMPAREAPGGTWHAANRRETPTTARYENLVVVMFSLLERCSKGPKVHNYAAKQEWRRAGSCNTICARLSKFEKEERHVKADSCDGACTRCDAVFFRCRRPGFRPAETFLRCRGEPEQGFGPGYRYWLPGFRRPNFPGNSEKPLRRHRAGR